MGPGRRFPVRAREQMSPTLALPTGQRSQIDEQRLRGTLGPRSTSLSEASGSWGEAKRPRQAGRDRPIGSTDRRHEAPNH